MISTILYSLWVLYTVGSLGIILFLLSFGLFAKWENVKHRKKLDEMFARNRQTDLEEEGW